MFNFFASLFGYVLNFLYNVVGNYGIAIILFSILVKIVMIPFSIKQQKTMKASVRIQDEMKQIQFKYKNDIEKQNQEIMSLYKRENMSPFSGCLSSIFQLILLISVFILVRSPLTYMVKMNADVINKLSSIVIEEENGAPANRYTEIQIIQYFRGLNNNNSTEIKEDTEKAEQEITVNDQNDEEIIQEEEKDEFNINDYKDQVSLNMDFLGIDLSAVPTQDVANWKTLIIPVLYVITSFISIKLTTATQSKMQNNKMITDGNESKQEEENNPMEQANKSMMWFMPMMAISIAIFAPLGLALYWLMSNILSIIERLILNKIPD